MGVGEDDLSGSLWRPGSIYFFFLELVHQDILAATLTWPSLLGTGVSSNTFSIVALHSSSGGVGKRVVCVLVIFKAYAINNNRSIKSIGYRYGWQNSYECLDLFE